MGAVLRIKYIAERPISSMPMRLAPYALAVKTCSQFSCTMPKLRHSRSAQLPSYPDASAT